MNIGAYQSGGMDIGAYQTSAAGGGNQLIEQTKNTMRFIFSRIFSRVN